MRRTAPNTRPLRVLLSLTGLPSLEALALSVSKTPDVVLWLLGPDHDLSTAPITDDLPRSKRLLRCAEREFLIMMLCQLAKRLDGSEVDALLNDLAPLFEERLEGFQVAIAGALFAAAGATDYLEEQ